MDLVVGLQGTGTLPHGILEVIDLGDGLIEQGTGTLLNGMPGGKIGRETVPLEVQQQKGCLLIYD